MPELHTLLTGLAFGESPRWHDGRLWFSDFGAQEVRACNLEGTSEVIARIPGAPMGLGFLPDGRLLIVSMRDGLLLRREHDGSLVTHADLSHLSRYPWSDLVVDGRGNAYLGNLGFNFPGGEFAPGILAVVTPDGEARTVAEGCAFANGLVVTPDNATLILAESYGHRLTAFDIEKDGTLSNRRVWADLGNGYPDGICLDAEGAVWYADVPARRCVRVRQGGEVLQTVELDRGCFACMLGGLDRRTLFLTYPFLLPSRVSEPAGRPGQEDPVSHGGRVSARHLGTGSAPHRPGAHLPGADTGCWLAVSVVLLSIVVPLVTEAIFMDGSKGQFTSDSREIGSPLRYVMKG